ncbi:MAG TPA: hypothetical protein VHP56_01830 [Solirubrobacterales bacterium]|nr:hypothetical protein [Solirubrobacterales bacterium]
MAEAIDRTEVPLVVILGAGASRGAGGAWGKLRPPLTVDLFDEYDYGDLLQEHDLAHQAGRYIAEECAGDDALSIEQVLHSLRHSEHVHHRRMAYSVPPYLQHLLHSVSEEHYRQVFRYDRLIERLLRLPHVCFMTLNYDVLLDRRLAAHHPLNDFEDYISEAKNWSLIKLHGSVNWVYEMSYPLDPYPPTEELRTQDHELRCYAPEADLEKIRGPGDGRDRYPALAIPEGPKDRLVLPSRHEWWITNRLRAAPNIDLLVIGYSGLDIEILKMLKAVDIPIRLRTFVNQSLMTAEEVRDRFDEAGLTAVWTETANGNFAEWEEAGGLDQLVRQFGGPYPDAH